MARGYNSVKYAGAERMDRPTLDRMTDAEASPVSIRRFPRSAGDEPWQCMVLAYMGVMGCVWALERFIRWFSPTPFTPTLLELLDPRNYLFGEMFGLARWHGILRESCGLVELGFAVLLLFHRRYAALAMMVGAAIQSAAWACGFGLTLTRFTSSSVALTAEIIVGYLLVTSPFAFILWFGMRGHRKKRPVRLLVGGYLVAAACAGLYWLADQLLNTQLSSNFRRLTAAQMIRYLQSLGSMVVGLALFHRTWIRRQLALLVFLPACAYGLLETYGYLFPGFHNGYIYASFLCDPVGRVLVAMAAARLLLEEDEDPTIDPGWCPACGYNLTGNTSGTCPECGRRMTPGDLV